MNKFTLVLIFLFVLFWGGASYAAKGSSSGKVKTVLWYEGHRGVLVVQENMADHGGCGRKDYYILDSNHEYFKEIYSLILTAHFSSQPLIFSLEGCVQGISRIKHVRSNKG